MTAKFPTSRPRRLRAGDTVRRLVRETRLSADQLIMPYFVREGRGVKEAIKGMPGQFRFSPDTLLEEIESLTDAGVWSVLLFGVPPSDKKDARGTYAFAKDGVIQQAVSEIKKRFPDLLVITDVCLCGYTDHGHCGMLTEKGEIANDPSLEILADMALSHARAGADVVAPSDMMDGRVRAIREKLDKNAMANTAILSYAAKYASAFYGPFRDAAHSAPAKGDRKSYQMDPANRREALREIAMDIEEGADMVMIKPALAYLDIVREARDKFEVPIAAYAVSGEYSMVKAAVERGLIDERQIVLEMMTSLARAGAQALITYHAKDLAGWLEISQPCLSKEVTVD